MPTILFVHGINVRGDAWLATYGLIWKKMQQFLPGYDLEGCRWGDAYGSSLHRGGASIPSYTATGEAGAATELANQARWDILASDPLVELRIYPAEEVVGIKSGIKIFDMVPALATQTDLLTLLSEFGVQELWPGYIQKIGASEDWSGAIRSVTMRIAAASEPVARAITAGYLIELNQKRFPGLSGGQRDRLKTLLTHHVGGPPLGILGDWAKRWATKAAADRRGAITDDTTPILGDVIHYQARGQLIRNFIAERAQETGATIVLAHSLGGIACVDWLAGCAAESKPAAVTHLITVGSQSGYFYEADAHFAMPFGAGIPEGFPAKWLNFYDPLDLLSYLAEPIFAGHAVDQRVDNRQPFPASHSAYWQNDAVWTRMAEFLGPAQ